MPILDYHNHLEPQVIYEDRCYPDIAEVWLGRDHYKWRAMRADGIGEDKITGKASGREKFEMCIRDSAYFLHFGPERR